MTKSHLRNLSLPELRDLVLAEGEAEYRYRQLATWIYARLESGYDAMTDLPKDMRDRLAERFDVAASVPVSIQQSAVDGTRKFLFEFADGARVESVLMRYDRRNTVCLSSQVGCPLDCVFCETA